MSNTQKRKTNFQLFQRDGYLNPAILQLFGIILLVVFVVVWIISSAHETSAILVGAALALIGLGSAGGALVTIRQEITERSQQHRQDLDNALDSDSEQAPSTGGEG